MRRKPATVPLQRLRKLRGRCVSKFGACVKGPRPLHPLSFAVNIVLASVQECADNALLCFDCHSLCRHNEAGHMIRRVRTHQSVLRLLMRRYTLGSMVAPRTLPGPCIRHNTPASSLPSPLVRMAVPPVVAYSCSMSPRSVAQALRGTGNRPRGVHVAGRPVDVVLPVRRLPGPVRVPSAVPGVLVGARGQVLQGAGGAQPPAAGAGSRVGGEARHSMASKHG